MISSREELKEYIAQDAIANWRNTSKKKFFGENETWKFLVELRKKEYYLSLSKKRRVLMAIPILINKYLYRKYSDICVFTIPPNVSGKGLALPHRGNIVINTTAVIGENCRIHQGATIGSTNGSREAAKIGNNVFIGSGAKLIGDITIADDVAIGANAVVVHSIYERGTTWGGGYRQKK